MKMKHKKIVGGNDRLKHWDIPLTANDRFFALPRTLIRKNQSGQNIPAKRQT